MAEAGRRWAAALALGAALAPGAVACRHAGWLPPNVRSCAGPLRPTQEIAGDFTRLARMRVRGHGVDESFGLVLQKTGDRLVVLGTNAFGAKVFAVTQNGARFETKSFVGPALSVPPENVLRDLHRAYFLTDAQARESDRSAEPIDGGVRIESERCGYEALLLEVADPKRTE